MQKNIKDIKREMLRFTGKVKGEILLSHAEYIREKEGEGGLEKLEEKMSELDAPIKFREIKEDDWISEGISALAVIVSKEIFSWNEKDVFEMGKHALHLSPALKFLLANVASPQRLFEESYVYWKNLFDFGRLDPVSFDKEKKEAILRIHGYKTDSLLCVYHAGYIKSLAEIILKKKDVSVEEIACAHKGDKYDEYKIGWK